MPPSVLRQWSPDTPWYNDVIRSAKHELRQEEWHWCKSKLTVHLEIFRNQKQHVHGLVNKAKIDYYNNLIQENASDSKILFRIVNKLLGDQRGVKLPIHHSLAELLEKFSIFFMEKIDRIRTSLGTPSNNQDAANPKNCISEFASVTEVEVKKIITSSPSKSCSLDPIPTGLLKQCVDTIVPFITKILNASLSTGNVPDSFKTALVTPLLKKSTLDANILKNYRPVSNLPFISKVLEKAVANRLTTYLTENNLIEPFQSAYRKVHSTETALLRVHNDILKSLDKGEAVLLVLLDLSAVFDTVDHDILLTLLKHRIGLNGLALSWVESYLKHRQQVIHLNGTSSSKQDLMYGVPQGSVLGPLFFTIYTMPLGDLLHDQKISYHFYADDTQLLGSFRPGTAGSLLQSISNMENCIAVVRAWMRDNMLKMNDEKTEFMVVSSKHARISIPSLQIGDTEIHHTPKVRNIGAFFDCHMTMETQVNYLCHCAFLQIKKLNSIRSYLSRETAEKLVHAFITSRLDLNNALLYGLPNCLLAKLQRVQNITARIICRTPKRQHITPVLRSLHWLPITQRIKYKIILLVFKALNGSAPLYLRELLKVREMSRTLRSSGKNLLEVPMTRTRAGDRAFSTAGPLLWNALPDDMRSLMNLETFKKLLKTYLFQDYYD